ncbi:MAG: sulfatase [Planctomycetes bacterium]|nr:sulfatase [Planctomycetota bacterium]
MPLPQFIPSIALAVLVAVPSVAWPFQNRSQQPRNVLFIISDDLNNRLGCYGDPLAKTPNLDKLAARGVRFDRAYCTFPLCGPSRNAIMTGLYPNSNGILQNGQIFRQTIPQHPSFAQALRLSGYLAGRIGKLYHYNVPNSVGTNGHDDPASWELEINPAGVERMEEHPRIKTLVPNQFGATLSWYASPAPESQHTDSMQASDAAWVLERCAKEPTRPFMLAVGFFRPHTPYVAPKSYFDLHDPEKMEIVNDVEEDRKDIPAPAVASGKKEQDDMSPETTREALQAYYASVSFMDAQVGKVIETLDRLGLTDSTLIIFTSDHGYHLGEHGLWQKMSLFEESARVPLLIVGPNLGRPGSVVKTPVSHVDLYPTLLEFTGRSIDAKLHGQSLIPLMRDPSSAGRGWALTQVTRGGGEYKFFGYSLRTERWRYTEWDEGIRGRELYDHRMDPGERTNLVSAPERRETVEDLSGQLRQAVAGTYPATGVTPEVRPMNWAPTLTGPD